uniref:Uncharacterized protein n=1 Tax=Amphiprion ocellaris TaxID=80972 RepID=A0A3Q1BIW9_AMPOC
MCSRNTDVLDHVMYSAHLLQLFFTSDVKHTAHGPKPARQTVQNRPARRSISARGTTLQRDRIKNLSRVYYKAAMGALVVFDITNSLTLKSATEWKQDLDSKLCLDNGRPVPAVLLANKCDLMKTKGEDLVSSLDRFCKDNNFLGWFETSAKENINIDEAGSFLVKQMMLCDGSLSDEEHQRDGIKSLTQTPMKISGTSCC